MSAETIKVYWAPYPFTDQDVQWNMLYRQPAPVIDNFYSDLTDDPQIVRCPVTRQSMKNIFSLNSNIEDIINFDSGLLEQLDKDDSDDRYPILVRSKVSLIRERKSSYKNFVNLGYNLSWIFFSEEPLVMRMAPPIFPVTTPTDGSILAFGKFDIGRYFRSINLDYHIPVTADKFSIKENQPLLFLEFETEKNIEFVRFKNTQLLTNLQKEFSDSPSRFGKNIPLIKKYEMAKRSDVLEIVLSEIRKNVI